MVGNGRGRISKFFWEKGKKVTRRKKKELHLERIIIPDERLFERCMIIDNPSFFSFFFFFYSPSV